MTVEMPEFLSVEAYDGLSLRWIATEKAMKQSAHTIKAYDLAWRKLGEFLSKSNETEITPLVLNEWKVDLLNSGLANNTVNLYMGSISRFLSWCVRMKVIAENPMDEVEIPKYTMEKQTIPTKSEILKLINHRPYILSSKKPIRNHAIVGLICLTGLRSDELRSLRLGDCDFEKEFILVRNGKGGKERKVPFPKKARELIREYLRSGLRPDWCTDEDYLFGSGNADDGQEGLEPNETKVKEWHKMDASVLGRIVKSYGKRVIGKNIHPHTLRHCAASLWDDADVSMRDVQKALGHSSITTTERVYMHILDDTKATSVINDALDEKLK